MTIRIMLDAGHYTNCNRSPIYPNYVEGNMTWQLCKYLKEELERYGFVVDTTRDSRDKDLDLYKRGYKAKGYDLFLSLHSNASNVESVKRVVIIKGYDQPDTLANILGNVVSEAMGITQKHQIYVRRKTNGQEWYGVLRGAKAAKVNNRFIIEHGFHTNKETAKWLCDSNNLRKIAQAEAKSLAEYYGLNKPKIENKGTYNCDVRVTTGLNVRASRPDNEGNLGEKIDILTQGTVVRLGYVYNGWGCVYYAKNNASKYGYVNVAYLELI